MRGIYNQFNIYNALFNKCAINIIFALQTRVCDLLDLYFALPLPNAENNTYQDHGLDNDKEYAPLDEMLYVAENRSKAKNK